MKWLQTDWGACDFTHWGAEKSCRESQEALPSPFSSMSRILPPVSESWRVLLHLEQMGPSAREVSVGNLPHQPLRDENNTCRC